MADSKKESKSSKTAESKSTKNSKSSSISNSAVKKPYKQFNFEPVNEIYDKEQFQRMVPEIEAIVQKHVDELPQDLLDNHKDAYDKLIKAKKSYESGYSKFKHGFIKFLMPFGFLLFVYPGILLYRKSKELQSQKNQLLSVISENEENVSKYNIAISFLLSPRLMLKEVNEKVLKYHDMGSIDATFLNKLEESNGAPILPSSLKNDHDQNTLNSSWGFFNDNIVINVAKKKHTIGLATYMGSATATYYVRDNNGNLQPRTETVSAVYQHPAPFYDVAARTYCYTEVSKKLDFSYNGYYTGKMMHKKPKSSKAPLENPDFDKHYDFLYNDDIGIRTIFTPWAQETYLKVNNEQEPHPMFQINKSSNWLFTNLDTLENHRTSFDHSGIVSDFALNPYYNINNLATDLKRTIVTKARHRFQSIGFMTILPTIKSEDQTDLANDIQKERFEKLQVTKGDMNEIFYVINNFYDKKELIRTNVIRKLDTEVMQYIPKPSYIVKCCAEDGTICTVAAIVNYSYRTIPRVTYIPTYAPRAGYTVDVPVQYTEYTKGESLCLLLHARVSEDLYFHSLPENNLTSESQLELEQQFTSKYQDYFNMNTLIAKDGTLAVFANINTDTQEDIVKNLNLVAGAFAQLVNFLNTKATLTTTKAENVMKWAIGAALLAKNVEKAAEEPTSTSSEGIKMDNDSLSKKDVTDDHNLMSDEQKQEYINSHQDQVVAADTKDDEPKKE